MLPPIIIDEVHHTTLADAASALGISVERARQLVAAGKIPVTWHLGKRWVPIDELDLMLRVEHRDTAARAARAISRWASAAEWAMPDLSGELDREEALHFLRTVDLDFLDASLALLTRMAEQAGIIAEAALEAGWITGRDDL